MENKISNDNRNERCGSAAENENSPGILRGPSGGGVGPAGTHKRGVRSWSTKRAEEGVEKERRSGRAFPRPGHLVLLERSSQGACLAGRGRCRPSPPHHNRELERHQFPQEPQGSPAGVQVVSPLAGPTSLKTARGGQVQDRSQ